MRIMMFQYYHYSLAMQDFMTILLREMYTFQVYD